MSTQTNLAESSIPALSERNEPMDIDLGERSEIEAEEANRERMDEEQHDEVEEEDAQEEEEEQEKEQDKNEEDGDESNEKKGKGKGKEKETEYEMDETSGERSAEWPFDSFPPIATLEPMAYEYTDVEPTADKGKGRETTTQDGESDELREEEDDFVRGRVELSLEAKEAIEQIHFNDGKIHSPINHITHIYTAANALDRCGECNKVVADGDLPCVYGAFEKCDREGEERPAGGVLFAATIGPHTEPIAIAAADDKEQTTKDS
ncbi:hypothetical protein EW026_g7727 [Hermanssonia centrifuga]|uniref:Uncharacterized protein n=1 Tax=Hermanssonia centrifuga TaxID=98765 RepID=A0A4S4K6T2_9APHY|nr:hypothetical protein EW026_g7727 [Hermanssonia centrifuga]